MENGKTLKENKGRKRGDHPDLAGVLPGI